MNDDSGNKIASRFSNALLTLAFIVLAITVLMMAAPIAHTVLVLAVVLFYLLLIVCTFFLILLNEGFRDLASGVFDLIGGEQADSTINMLLSGIPIAGGIAIGLFFLAFLISIINRRRKGSTAKAIVSMVFLILLSLALGIYYLAKG